MGNRPPAKGREEAAEEGEDRISELPQHILQNHIPSLLPQNDAVRTCVLSKSWRHLGPTRPNIEFRNISFKGSTDEFISAVENTLQRYVDQKLSIQEFVLETWGTDSLLHTWIPKVILRLGAKTFNLKASKFSLPRVVFQAEFLEELVLHGCNLDHIKYSVVKLHALKRLELCQLFIEEETFERIFSSCPLIQHLVCEGIMSRLWLTTKKVINRAWNLKHLETIRIKDFHNGYHLHNNNNNFFPRLKSLYLYNLRLTTDSLDNLSSNNCPSLEELQIHDCHGFREFKLSSRSIKRLIINEPNRPIKVAIDAANILYFEFISHYYLPSISFAPTSREWESHVHVMGRYSAPSALHEFLKALSQSQISLFFSCAPNLTNQETYDGDSRGPVVVEHFILSSVYPPSSLSALFKIMFRICRPRYIGLPFSTISLCSSYKRRVEKSIWKILVKKGSRQCKFWKQDLEESSIQVFDKNTEEWGFVQVRALPHKKTIRFRLKWREDLS